MSIRKSAHTPLTLKCFTPADRDRQQKASSHEYIHDSTIGPTRLSSGYRSSRTSYAASSRGGILCLLCTSSASKRVHPHNGVGFQSPRFPDKRPGLRCACAFNTCRQVTLWGTPPLRARKIRHRSNTLLVGAATPPLPSPVHRTLTDPDGRRMTMAADRRQSKKGQASDNKLLAVTATPLLSVPQENLWVRG